jgi:hypothetical protein
MCENCWNDYGRPAIVNAATLAALEMVKDVYAKHAAGGLAHIVLHDFNIEDESVEWCIKDGFRANDESDALAIKALHAFRSLTVAERASVLAMHMGFVSTGEN